jgi:hypothetical protein
MSHMSSLHVPSVHGHRVAPASPSAWFAVAIPATVVSLVVAGFAWSASGNSWIGLAAWLVVAALVAVVADRVSHRSLAAYVGGAVITLAGLLVVPLVMAHYYIVH